MKAGILLLTFLASSLQLLAAGVDDFTPVDWSVHLISAEDWRSKTFKHQGGLWGGWVGNPGEAFKQEKAYNYDGSFAFHTHFPLKRPLTDADSPTLVVNGLPDGCSLLLNGKPFPQINELQKGPNEFTKERWFALPREVFKQPPAHNCIIIWATAIRKSVDDKFAPVSKIEMNDPGAVARKALTKKLQAPYLNDETEDPYVGRHW